MDKDLSDRLFNFSIDVIRFCRSLSKSTEFNIIKYQLIKAATSCGANFEEAQAASSRPDFKHRISICLREMIESNYWIKIIYKLDPKYTELKNILDESQELKSILGSIVKKL